MSEHLDAVREERSNGRLSPAVAGALEDLHARVAELEKHAPKSAPKTPKGGE